MKTNEEVIQNALKVISLKYDELVSVIKKGDLKAIRILQEIRKLEEIFSEIGIPIEIPKLISDLISEEEKQSIYLACCENGRYIGGIAVVYDSEKKYLSDSDYVSSIDETIRQSEKFFSFIEFTVPKKE